MSPKDKTFETVAPEVLHTIAVAGVSVNPGFNVKSTMMEKTHFDFSQAGMFTLMGHDNEVTVFIPLITLDALNKHNRICPPVAPRPAIFS